MNEPAPHRPTGLRSTQASATGTPRWVKSFGFAAIVFLVLFVILHLTGNGMAGHG